MNREDGKTKKLDLFVYELMSPVIIPFSYSDNSVIIKKEKW